LYGMTGAGPYRLVIVRHVIGETVRKKPGVIAGQVG
jgi:hypothetical protein